MNLLVVMCTCVWCRCDTGGAAAAAGVLPVVPAGPGLLPVLPPHHFHGLL